MRHLRRPEIQRLILAASEKRSLKITAPDDFGMRKLRAHGNSIKGEQPVTILCCMSSLMPGLYRKAKRAYRLVEKGAV